MTKVLLTGGSGFIAAHILEKLLARGHSVITTVRSESKAAPIRSAHADLPQGRLQVVIVPDIAQPNAFDEVIKAHGGEVEVVLHTASPFHFNWSDPRELLDPAIIGTTGILRAIARDAPLVKRVVITSSFAAILDQSRFADPTAVFSEKTWNPVKEEDASRDKPTAYRASKTLAERAAWDFVSSSPPPKFDLVTICPPAVFGPAAHHVASLDAINVSNERIAALMSGAWRDEVPTGGPVYNWIDVRDCAEAHVRAGLEIPAAGGRRLFTIASTPFGNRDIADVVRKRFGKEYGHLLPPADAKGGEMPEEGKRYRCDCSETDELLGIEWMSLEKSMVDAIKNFQEIQAQSKAS